MAAIRFLPGVYAEARTRFLPGVHALDEARSAEVGDIAEDEKAVPTPQLVVEQLPAGEEEPQQPEQQSSQQQPKQQQQQQQQQPSAAPESSSGTPDDVPLACRPGLSPPAPPSRSDLPTGSAVTEARTAAEVHAARDGAKEVEGGKEGLLLNRREFKRDFGQALVTSNRKHCLADAIAHGQEVEPQMVREGIGNDHSFARAAAYVDEAFPETALEKASARFMVGGGIELALLNARSGRFVLSMSYTLGGVKRYHCAYFEPSFAWEREDLERGWLSGSGVLKDNQADVAVHLAEAADRASTGAARAFFQAPYAVALRIEAVYELVPRGAGGSAKRQKVDCRIQHGALPDAPFDSSDLLALILDHSSAEQTLEVARVGRSVRAEDRPSLASASL